MKKLQQKNLLSAAITALLCTAVVVPFAASAGGVTFSGQINRMVANIDNGVDSNLQFVDNNSSGTRLRAKGEMDTGTGMKVGFYWETQYQSNNSNSADATTVADTGDNTSTRHRDIWLKGDFGKISLGQGAGAADDSTEMDYTGTQYLTGYGGTEFTWGNVTFGGVATKVKNAYGSYDGLSRNDRIRYDSPKLGSVTLSMDMGNGGKTEFAASFDTKMDGGKLKAKLATWDKNDAADPTKTGNAGSAGSVAYMANSGMNAAFAFSNFDGSTANPADASYTMITLGYKTGHHALSLRLGSTDDIKDGSAVDSTEFGYVNRSMKAVEMYAGLQTYSINEANAQDITIVFGGARVKF